MKINYAFLSLRGGFFFHFLSPFHSFNTNTKNGKSYNVYGYVIEMRHNVASRGRIYM